MAVVHGVSRVQLGYCSLKIPDSVTGSWSSEEGLYSGLECAGRVFDRGRLLVMDYELVHMVASGYAVDAATVFEYSSKLS